VPWFSTLFGRDALITAFQALAVRPRLAVETLTTLAAYQATEDDPTRDAEPGKILHELRTGEMARNGELPHTPYYGSVDSTPLWLVLLGATYDWTGDAALVDRLWPHALAALDWIDHHGDRDGDGFVEYERRSDRGLVNQGWKDSSDAIRDRHGREAVTPIALAEVQGYVFDAKRRLATLARMRGDEVLATRLERDAETLRQRFEDAFWVEDQRYYAMALDGDKHPADAIGSNAGQCLWTGIVAPDRARDVVDHLLRPAMFSGWGIRTYATGQPGFNPIGYHTGTVWPHDTSLIAAGFKRYGFHDASNRLAGQMLEAAQRFPDYRLPELFCGFDRTEATTPVPYPVACSPQAWAAGASFLFLETMLGLRAHADRQELELANPHLPDWLGKVTLTDLQVGEASVDLLFHRWRGTTSAEVLRKTGDLAVTVRL
jgi:glycogen debranching enzyme